MSLDSLLRSGRQIVVLLEAQSSAGPRYASNAGYVASAIDPVAPNRAYPDWLAEVPEVRQSLPDTLFGRSDIGWSDALISNPSGVRDSWLDEAWDGRSVRLLVGASEWTLDQFVPVFAGVATSLQATAEGALRLAMSEPRERLNRPVQSTLIATGPATGEPAPLCWGTVFNIEPTLIDTASHTYRVHESAVVSVDQVYVGGLPVSYTDNGDGTLTLGVFPDGRVTADVRGGLVGGVAIERADQIMQHIAERVGVTDIDTANLFAAGSTNLALWSEQFDRSTWGKVSAIVSPDVGIAPDGSTTADGVTATATDPSNLHQPLTKLAAVGETLTLSIWARSASAGATIRLGLGRTSSNPSLQSGVIPLTAVWQRYTLAWTPVAGDGGLAVFLNFQFAAGIGCEIWGAQVEVGPAPTQYIPTTSVAVTRARSAPQRLGLYLRERANAIDVLDQVAQSVGAWWGFDGLGRLTAAVAQIGVPALALTADDIGEFGVSLERVDTPSWRRRVGYRRNYSIQADGLFAAVPESTRQRLGREWDIAEAASPSSQTLHPLALDPDIEGTLLIDGAQARAESARRLAMFGVPAKRLRVSAFSRAWTLRPGDTARLTHPRFGLAAGRDLLVLAVQRRVSSRETVLTLWAGGTLIAGAPTVLATEAGEVLTTEAGEWITVQEAA